MGSIHSGYFQYVESQVGYAAFGAWLLLLNTTFLRFFRVGAPPSAAFAFIQWTDDHSLSIGPLTDIEGVCT